MPFPKLTDAIIASGTPPVDGWSLGEFVGSRTMKARESESTNYFYDFSLEMGPGQSDENKNKQFAVMIPGGGLEAGVANVCMAYKQMLCALTGLNASELSGQELNEDSLKGRKCWIQLKTSVSAKDGIKRQQAEGFFPEGEVPF